MIETTGDATATGFHTPTPGGYYVIQDHGRRVRGVRITPARPMKGVGDKRLLNHPRLIS